MIKTKPEHTPAPTPGRAVYGFCLFVLINTLFIIYIFWSFLPKKILNDTLNLNYLPDKYFSLYIPILILCCTTIFAFFIYPSLSLSMTSDIDDECTIHDKYTIYRCKFIDNEGQKCDNKANITKKLNNNNELTDLEKTTITSSSSTTETRTGSETSNEMNYNDWSIPEYCEYHYGYINDRLNDIENDEQITNICDCSIKEYCLLNDNPNYVKNLKKRQKVPTICDLDLSEICNKMFDN